jgi:hypothetical protein
VPERAWRSIVAMCIWIVGLNRFPRKLAAE